MNTPKNRRRAIASLTAAALIGGGTWALAANPAPESFAFVARGDNPVDALAAAALAGRLNAPVILTEPTVLTDAARRSLLEADPDTVWIAGGPTAISADVQLEIQSLLPDADVERAAGGTRYDTAEQLAGLFGDIDPNFLVRDGKANAADVADVAKDAQKFGGLAPAQYQFTEVNRQGEFQSFSFPGTGDTTRDILPPMTIDVPADGMLQIDALAAAPSGEIDTILALVDFDGPVDVSSSAGAVEVYDHAGMLMNPTTPVYLRVPVRVAAGEHTIRLVAVGSDTTVDIGLRSLSVHYTSGVSGPWEEFDVPPPPPAPVAPSGESDMLRDLLVGADA